MNQLTRPWRIVQVLPYLLVLAFLLAGCREKEDAGTPSAPEWGSGPPNVLGGATTADVAISTTKPARVDYFLSSRDMSFTPPEFKSRVTKSESDTFSLSGSTELKEQLKTTVTLKGLKENTTYHVYLLAQNLSDSLHQQQVHKLTFTTKVRQDTASFYSAAENRNVDYLIYKPEEVLKYPEKESGYPVAFFLGGLGERATPSRRIGIISNGLLPEYIHKGNDVPMMVFSIQHATPEWNRELIREGIEHGLANLPADPKRVYLVGTSAGAFGVWDFAVSHPEKLAAIVAISGAGDPELACELKNVSVSAFHNTIDDVVSPSSSINMVKAINDCSPAKKALLELFPDPGHNVWRRVFDPAHPDWAKSPDMEKIDIYSWLTQQSR